MKKATWLHLRIPFSFFLMPVFLFAIAVVEQPSYWKIGLSFFILHVLVYPASNAFNSYYDRDEGSIGGLEKPPPVSDELLWASLILDTLAFLLAFFLGYVFAFAILIYGLVSKAYSHPSIRLKKYSFLSWLTIGFFQGAFTFWMVYLALSQSSLSPPAFWGGILSSCMLLGSYPMTQVYQHEEDSQRGDRTLSLILGIRGTFLFTMNVFGAVSIAYFFYFWHFYTFTWAILFELSLVPVLVYFFYWFSQVWKDEHRANFQATMRLNLISALALNTFFLLFGLY